MNVNEDIIKLLQGDMNSYNSEVYNLAGNMATSLEQIGLILLSLFLVFEIVNIFQAIRRNNGEMQVAAILETVMKYIVAFVLVMYSKEILDAILWLVTKTVGLVSSENTNDPVAPEFELSGSGIWIKMLSWFYEIARIIAEIVTKIIIMLRFVQLYLMKIFAPLMVAFFMSEPLRSIAVSFLKRFAAYALQGLVLIVVLIIFPMIISTGLFEVSEAGSFGEKFTEGVMAIIQSIVFIITIVGTQRMAKEMMGV